MAQFLEGTPGIPVSRMVIKFDRLAKEMHRAIGKGKISTAGMLATEAETVGYIVRWQRIDRVPCRADDLT